ncbi:hypothetical protein DLAC_11617 [Tieghemostelium lacteum]|uniref:Nudix hydrolase domain-containing protein n=1 Tax=Tieghemostelium lacteum TaxID=361077 RepID=A0A151ZJ01_TIELA|nr:hypothetical protein DLAC_11617 [Tieghemostelium lacteum]|eukprot:KYQ93824.1 hypothetical protein DLAC_11617 [Tieghemostelium lacteum]
MEQYHNVKIEKIETLYKANWLQLNKISFTDSKNKIRSWESVDRTTKKGDTDGVDIIAIVNKDSQRHLICVLQFRAPIGKLSLEFPAGLVDGDESAEVSANRELLEETGYTSKSVCHVSPTPMSLEPGLSSANTRYVIINVKEELLQPQQHLEENELIEVLLIPLDSNIADRLNKIAIERNCQISSQLYAFALGLSFQTIFS